MSHVGMRFFGWYARSHAEIVSSAHTPMHQEDLSHVINLRITANHCARGWTSMGAGEGDASTQSKGKRRDARPVWGQAHQRPLLQSACGFWEIQNQDCAALAESLLRRQIHPTVRQPLRSVVHCGIWRGLGKLRRLSGPVEHHPQGSEEQATRRTVGPPEKQEVHYRCRRFPPFVSSAFLHVYCGIWTVSTCGTEFRSVDVCVPGYVENIRREAQ